MDFLVLGPLDVRDHGRPLALGGLRQRATLAYLLLNANRVVAVSALLEALWDGEPPTTARRVVHNAVSGLRKILTPTPGDPTSPLLETQAPGYVLRVDPERLDLQRFTALSGEGRAALAEGDPAHAAQLLRAALSQWRGPALADLAETGLRWPQVAGLEERRQVALEDRIEADLQLGRQRELVPELESLVRTAPLRERLHGLRMRALYRAGRQGDALAAYHQARRVLVDHLGVEPGEELRRLERAILAQEGTEAPLRPVARTAPVPVPERKRVTVLVALVAERADATGDDPEDEHELADRVRTAVKEAATRLDGVPQDVVGVTAAALFGVPRSAEDDGERAIRAALIAQDLLGPEDRANVRLAVADGLAVVSPPAGRGSGWSITDTVLARAARLALVTEPGQTAVGEGVRRATTASARYERSFGQWLLLGMKPGPAGRRLLDLGTPLVDRDRELALLSSLVERTRLAHRPGLVTVLGSAGIGKTRLVHELLRTLRAAPDPPVVRRAAVHQHAGDATSMVLAAVLRDHTGIHESDPCAVAEAKLAGALAAAMHDEEEVAWAREPLRRLLGLAAAPAEGAAPREETVAAWRRMLEGVAAPSGLVLVVEDLHWADDELLELIGSLADSSAPVGWATIATARPDLAERSPRWGSGLGLVTLSLGPLSACGTRRLLEALLTRHQLPEDALPEDLPDRVGGSPLFAEEYVRLLAERGSEEVPRSVEALIAARIDRLPAEGKRVLQDLAVLGQEGSVEAVAAVGRRDHEDAAAQLRQLEAREFLRRVPAPVGSAAYAFRHVLVRDVAYRQTTRAQRIDRHERAAAHLETLPADQAELLPHHYQTAVALARAEGRSTPGLELRARRSLRATAERARLLGAAAAAARCYKAALELTPPGDPERPLLLLRYGQQQFSLDGSAQEELAEARDALEAAGDRVGAAEAEAALSDADWLAGRGPQGRARRDRALALIQGEPPSPAVLDILLMIAGFRRIEGDNAGAVPLAEEALRMAQQFGAGEAQSRALGLLGAGRVMMGDAGGLADQERAVALYGERWSPQRVRTQTRLANCRAILGDVPGYAAELTGALHAAARFRLRRSQRWLEGERAIAAWLTGSWDAALEWCNRILAEGAPQIVTVASALLVRGRVQEARGDVQGRREIARAMALLSDLPDFQVRQSVYAIGARIALAEGREDDAAAAAAQLIDLLSAGSGFLSHESGIDLPMALLGTGYGPEALTGQMATPWLKAAQAYLARDFSSAAEGYAEIGSVPDELLARLAAADDLDARGERAGAEAQRKRAAFLAARAGATAWAPT